MSLRQLGLRFSIVDDDVRNPCGDLSRSRGVALLGQIKVHGAWGGGFRVTYSYSQVSQQKHSSLSHSHRRSAISFAYPAMM